MLRRRAIRRIRWAEMRRTRAPRRTHVLVRRAAQILVFALALVIVVAGPAGAHPFLVTSTPQAGERLSSSPTAIVLRFSEPIAGGERVVVRDAKGRSVSTRPPTPPGGASVVRVPLPPLTAGVYRVSWQVLGSDANVAVGDFVFAVGPGGTILSEPTQAGPIDWPEAAATSVLLFGLLVAFGALLSERAIWSPVAREHGLTVPRLPIGWLLGAAVVGACGQLALFAHRLLSGGQGPAGSSWAAVLTGRPGALAWAEIIFVGYALWIVLIPLPRMRPWAVAPLVVAISAAAVRGHEGATSTWWAGPANAVHLLAVATWVGALAHSALVAWRLRSTAPPSVLLAGLRRYAGLALLTVLAVLLTGALVALSQLTSVSAAIHTTYGRLLLVKSAVAAVALTLAFVARRGVLPASPRARPGPLRSLVTAEAGFLGAAVLVAAFLGNAPTPRSLAPASLALGPAPLRGPVVHLAGLAGSLAVFLAAAPGRLQVQAIAPTGTPAPGTAIDIGGQAPDGAVVSLSPRPCGPGCLTSPFAWPRGTTTFSVRTSSTRWGRGGLTFRATWPPRPEEPSLLVRTIRTMRAQRSFRLNERVTSGAGALGVHDFRIGGERFVAAEPYSAGTVSDVRQLPRPAPPRTFVTFLAGSWIWLKIELDGHGRIRRETVVSPGHLIQRTFAYRNGP